jgi:aspartyl-tRNA synthetase
VRLYLDMCQSLNEPDADAHRRVVLRELTSKLCCSRCASVRARARAVQVRLWCADAVESAGTQLRDPSKFAFTWVDGFPLFELDDDGKTLRSTHHVSFTLLHAGRDLNARCMLCLF